MNERFKAYRVTNRFNGKVYIGITTMAVSDRWRTHVSYALKGTTKGPLASAIRKYGAEGFSVEHIASALSWVDLCAAETMLIAQHGSFWRGYNATLGGNGLPGYQASQETKDRRRESYLLTLAQQGGSLLKGRPKSVAHKASMAISRRAVMARDPSLRTRMVIAAATSRSVVRKNSNSRGLTDEQVSFATSQRAEGVRLRDLAAFYGVTRMAIANAVSRKTYKHVPMPAWSA